MIREQVSCDVCSVDQKEVNGWWVCWSRDGVFQCAHLSQARSMLGKEDFQKARHACGNEHAGLLHSRWMSNGTFDMES